MMYRIVGIKDSHIITLARVFSDSVGEPFDLPMDMVIDLQPVSRVHNRTGTLAVGMEFWMYANPAPDTGDIDYSDGKTANCFFTEAQAEDIERQIAGDGAA